MNFCQLFFPRGTKLPAVSYSIYSGLELAAKRKTVFRNNLEFLVQSCFKGNKIPVPGRETALKPRSIKNVTISGGHSLSGAAASAEFTSCIRLMRNQPVGALLRAFTGFFICLA